MLNEAGRLALTGIWHGANWNFYSVGLYYFVLLVIEKELFDEVPEKALVWPHIYTLFLVVLLGAVHLQRPRCTVGAAAQPAVHPAGRRFGAVFPAQLCGAGVAVKEARSLHPTAGAVLAVGAKASPATAVLCGVCFVLCTAYVVAATGSTALYANF